MSANHEASPTGKLNQSNNYNSVVHHTANSPSAASVSNSTMPLTALPSASKAKLGKVFDSLGVFNDELRGKTTVRFALLGCVAEMYLLRMFCLERVPSVFFYFEGMDMNSDSLFRVHF